MRFLSLLRTMLKKKRLLPLLPFALSVLLLGLQFSSLGKSLEQAMFTVVAKTTPFFAFVAEKFKALKPKTTQDLHKLECENAALKSKISHLRAVSQENKTLKKALNWVKEQNFPLVTAAVLTSPFSHKSHLFFIRAGRKHGIRTGQPVVSRYGFVGRIERTTRTLSRVRPLIHEESSLPGFLAQSGNHGIVQGNGTTLLNFVHIESPQKFKAGTPVVTSSRGGMGGAGFLLGTLLPEKGHIQIKSAIPWQRLSTVHVILTPQK